MSTLQLAELTCLCCSYRTHLSPTLRRGSGSAARAAVNQAMEQAGLKSTTTRAPRKSKSSTNGTPSSNTSTSTSHILSPYHTPTSQNGPIHYGYPQLYDSHPYPYPLPSHNASLTNNQNSATSSRGPSPANGHSSGHSSVSSVPGSGGPLPPPHHQQFYPQPFPQATYPYPYPQAYRYPPPAGPMHTAYGPSHAPPPMYSPGLAPEHANHMYPPMGGGSGGVSYPTHSRESSFSGVMPPGYPMGNGFPRNASTSSIVPPPPLHPNSTMSVGDVPGGAGTGRGRYSPGRRPSPRPSPPNMLSQGVVDPNSMNSRSGLHLSYGPASTSNGHPGAYGQPSSLGHPHPHLSAYAYGSGHAANETLLRGQGRASISSLSEDGSGEHGSGSDGSGSKKD